MAALMASSASTRAVDLHRRQAQLIDDVGVLDLERFVHGLAAQPFRRQRRTGDGAAAAEGLELGVFDHAGFRVHLHLQLHHVAAFGRAHHAGADVGIALVERADVAGIIVMIQNFV